METEFHILAWEVERQRWRETGEGPWTTFIAAQEFADNEVGLPWRIVAVVPILQCH